MREEGERVGWGRKRFDKGGVGVRGGVVWGGGGAFNSRTGVNDSTIE